MPSNMRNGCILEGRVRHAVNRRSGLFVASALSAHFVPNRGSAFGAARNRALVLNPDATNKGYGALVGIAVN